MNEPLRPSTLGEILDRTANLYRSRFLVFFGIAAVPAAVVLGFAGGFVLLIAWAGTTGPSGTVFVGLGAILLSLIALPLMIAANALSGAALCHAAGALTMGGTIAIRPAFKAVWSRGWRYIGLYLLQMLIIFGAPAIIAFVLLMILGMIAAFSAQAGGAAAGVFAGGLMFLLFLGIFVYVIWMLLKLCLAFPIAVAEQAGVGAALKRAWTLSRGACWRMLVLFLLGLVISWIASFMLMIPLIIAMAVVPSLNSPQHAQTVGTAAIILYYAISFAVQALTWPIYAIALMLFYYDQRIRKEGFDIELMMQRAGMVAVPGPQPEPAPWMPGVRHTHIPAAESAPAPESGPPVEAGGPAVTAAETGAEKPAAPVSDESATNITGEEE